MIKKILALMITASAPIGAYAHVKWFARHEIPVRPYAPTDVPVMTWILVSLLVVVVGIVLEKKLQVPPRLRPIIEKVAPVVLSLASVGFGIAFIIFSLKGFIFAPNLPAEGTIGSVLLILQGIAGAMMVLGLYERWGGFLIVLLGICGMLVYGIPEMIDTLEMLGFAIYAMIVGRPYWKIAETKWLQTCTHKIHEYGVPLLRVGTGLNLIALGLSEKILDPSLTQSFLTDYQWNFVSALGLQGMTDYWFAFSAGMVEILFGLFFVLGLVTRTTTIVLTLFLITTLILLGPTELIGHLPHFSIALVLLVLGSGSRLVLVRPRGKD